MTRVHGCMQNTVQINIFIILMKINIDQYQYRSSGRLLFIVLKVIYITAFFYNIYPVSVKIASLFLIHVSSAMQIKLML